ncbi:MAG: alanine racemase, partial [Spirochaetota bacterium]
MIESLQIKKPTLILNRVKLLNNIEKMNKKARKSGVVFRPHFKTHHSKEIGGLFRDFSIRKITVSSVDMAVFFAEDGWRDISVAFPVNILEVDEINYLASNLTLNLLVESAYSVSALQSKINTPVNLFIKIDVGYHRTGIRPENLEAINSILNIIKKSNVLNFKGFLTHAGHSYYAENTEQIINIHNQSTGILNSLK